jgi:hypothetical protein
MFIRVCPKCNDEITYKHRGNFNTAVNKNNVCKRCAESNKHSRNIIQDREKFFNLYSKERMTEKEIAEIFNITVSYVRNYANDNNINRRDYDIQMEENGLKRCHTCKTFKEFNEFHNSKNTRDGLTTACKECQLKKSKVYREENCELLIIKSKRYTEKIKKENPELLQEWRRNGKKNYSKTEKGKWDSKCRSILRKVLKKMGLKKNSNTNILLGYSPEDMMNHLKRYELFYVGGYEVDHKIPISYFKVGTHPKIVNSLDNLWLTTIEYNQTKSNKWSEKISKDYYEIIKDYIKEDYLHLIETHDIQ